jgi:phage-related protein
MAGEIGKATIEIVADLSRFPADLRRKLKAAFAEGVKGVDMHGLEDEAAKEGDRAATAAGRSFERKAKTEFDRAGRTAGRGLLSAIGDIFRRDGGSRGGLGGVFRNLFQGASDSIKDGLTRVQSAAQSAGGALAGLAGGGGDIAGLLKVTAIVAAIPAVFALAGALVHLSGILLALPAAFGILGSAIAPLIIGFQGFGEAIGAGFSGDAAKFQQALKGLAEPARTVVKEIVGLHPIFSAIKKDVQTALFAPLIGQFTALGRTLLPIVRGGLEGVADSLGRFLGGLLEVLRAQGVLNAFRTIFITTGQVVDRVGGALTGLFHTLFVVMGAGAPFAKRLFDGLADGITKFSNFLARAVADGSFQRFLENAFTIGRKLITIVGKVGELIGAIFGGQNVADSSGDFLDNLTASLQHLIDFFKSDDGKKAIADFLKTVKSIGEVVEFLGSAIAATIRIFDQFSTGIDDVVGGIAGFFNAIGSGATSGASAVGDFFTKTIPGWFDSLVGFFEALPGRVVTALGDLGATMRHAVADAVRSMVDDVFTNVGRLIGIFFSLPFLIGKAIEGIPAAFASVVSFFSGLGATVRGLVADVASSIGDAFLHGFELAKGWVQSGSDAIRRFIHAIPGFILGVGPALKAAAASLGHKIGEGLSQIGNFASDIGHKIVNTVRGGVNSIIRSINGGIADIDNKLPISLPRLPFLARGGIIDSPTVALVGEKGREVVLPLTNPQRTRELAAQSGLTKILGAQPVAPNVSVTAILDGFGLIKVIDLRVDQALGEQGDELAFGART